MEIYNQETLRSLQAAELHILKELDRICKQMSIDFFLYGGTLIGAIKFNGFVPWDDDIDVAMKRSDYEQFIKAAPGLLSGQYVLQTPYSDRKSPYPYTKLRRKGTSCVEYGVHKLKIEQGIYIDIYPVDHLPDDDAVFQKKHQRFQKAARLFSYRQCPYLTRKESGLRGAAKKISKYAASWCLKCVPARYFINKMDKIATEYNSTPTSRYGNYYHSTPVNVFSSIEPFVKGTFAGIDVNLPHDWDGFLRKRYGSYESLPPEEKRIGHKPYLLNFGAVRDEA